MKGKLLLDAKAMDCEIVSERAMHVLSEDRLRILKLLDEPRYPAEVAKELKMQSQTVYYHFRILEQAKLIELVDFAERGGAMAKRYKSTAEAIAFLVTPAWKNFSLPVGKPPKFLSTFFSGGEFDGKFVVGSPDPHGKHRSRGSEFCAMEIAMYLGALGSFSYPLYYLDTEVKDHVRKGNMILLGGPKVNSVVEEAAVKAPISFDASMAVVSNITGKRYEENVGVVELFENPWNKSKKILLVAGLNHASTRVGVLALLKKQKELEKGNQFDASVLARVVQGFDEDGDGIVDEVEFLE